MAESQSKQEEVAEPSKRVRLTAYDARGGAPKNAYVEPVEGETIGQLFERTFPESETKKTRLFAEMNGEQRLAIAEISKMGGFYMKGDDGSFEFTVDALVEDPDFALTVTPNVMVACAEGGGGRFVVKMDDKVVSSYKITGVKIHAPQ